MVTGTIRIAITLTAHGTTAVIAIMAVALGTITAGTPVIMDAGK